MGYIPSVLSAVESLWDASVDKVDLKPWKVAQECRPILNTIDVNVKQVVIQFLEKEFTLAPDQIRELRRGHLYKSCRSTVAPGDHPIGPSPNQQQETNQGQAQGCDQG